MWSADDIFREERKENGERAVDGGDRNAECGLNRFRVVKLFASSSPRVGGQDWTSRDHLVALNYGIGCLFRTVFCLSPSSPAMSSTPISHPAVQRLNNAYVQVPVSPLTSSRNRVLSTSTHVAPSSKLKENTPLRPSLFAMQQHSSASASLKRKITDRDGPSQILDGVIISTKKSKLSIDVSTPLKSRQTEFSTILNNASEEFPNGFVYCHQCNKKRDATGKHFVTLHLSLPDELVRHYTMHSN